jgi:predicted enzyme related to lactoylglutathione lyase
MGKVIALGGPFIKSKDPKALAAWYEKNLGVPFNGNTYASWPMEKSEGSNVLTFFKEDNKYFDPSTKDVMLNFVVDDLFGLLDALKAEGVTIIGDPMDESYGKFGWIMDPEGNKIELWEPAAS